MNIHQHTESKLWNSTFSGDIADSHLRTPGKTPAQVVAPDATFRRWLIPQKNVKYQFILLDDIYFEFCNLLKWDAHLTAPSLLVLSDATFP